MVKPNAAPLSANMAAFATGAKAVLVDILNAVAANASARQILINFARMAGGAGHARVAVLQREAGLRMVKISDLHPVGGGMAICTFAAQRAIMRLVILMAIHTLRRRLAKFFAIFMAACTGGRLMRADQGKIGLAMVKHLFIQRDNIGFQPDMVRVALAATIRPRLRRNSMKPSLGLHIQRHLFMAIKTQGFLCTLREILMAITTVFLQVGMALNKISGQNQALKYALRMRRKDEDYQRKKRGEKAEESWHSSKDAQLKHGPMRPKPV